MSYHYLGVLRETTKAFKEKVCLFRFFFQLFYGSEYHLIIRGKPQSLICILSTKHNSLLPFSLHYVLYLWSEAIFTISERQTASIKNVTSMEIGIMNITGFIFHLNFKTTLYAFYNVIKASYRLFYFALESI